jgi:hypothetical protein
MSEASLHRELVWEQAEKLRSQGYDVILYPSADKLRETLPSFQEIAQKLATYHPDAIGRSSREGDLVVVQVLYAHAIHENATWLKSLQDLLAPIPEATILIVDKDAEAQKLALRVPTLELLEEKLLEAESLLSMNHIGSSLLLTWSLFEAAVRRATNNKLSRPQLPKSVVNMAAHEGFLLPDEVDFAKSMISARNRYVHGDFAVGISPNEVRRLISIVQVILKESATVEAA